MSFVARRAAFRNRRFIAMMNLEAQFGLRVRQKLEACRELDALNARARGRDDELDALSLAMQFFQPTQEKPHPLLQLPVLTARLSWNQCRRSAFRLRFMAYKRVMQRMAREIRRGRWTYPVMGVDQGHGDRPIISIWTRYGAGY